jgi:hypothetical protein
MKIPFVGPAYEGRSLNADAQRCLNCYLEMDGNSPRAPIALHGTPGLALELTLPTSPIRGAAVLGDFTIVVAGSTVYRLTSAYTVAVLGVLHTSTGRLGIASNGAELLIVDGQSGWLVTIASLSEIADLDFPIGVTQATFISGFFLVAGDGTQKFYINETPNAGSSWNGLDFASAEGSPDLTIGCLANQLEVWLFGANSAEIWTLTGDSDFPLARSGNAFIEVGCAAPGSIAKLDSSVFWLGSDQRGSGIVWRGVGYTPGRISNHALEKAIQGYGDVSDAFAMTYQQEGHGFYVLTFPSADKTWVYDVATNQWHERAYRNPSTGSLHRWRPSCHVFAFGKHLAGDFENGKLWRLDLDTYADGEDPILRLRTTQCLDSPNGELIKYAKLQVDMETGVGLTLGQGSAPLLMLRFSNDGGHTWSNQKTASIGAIGNYGERAVFRRLGQGRNRVWEVSMTDPVKFAMFGAFANPKPGTF